MNDNDKQRRAIEAIQAGQIEDATLDRLLADLPQPKQPAPKVIHAAAAAVGIAVGRATIGVRLPLASAVATLRRVAGGLRIRGNAEADEQLSNWAQSIEGVKQAVVCTVKPGFGLTVDGIPLEARNPLLGITKHRRNVLEAMARRPLNYEWERDDLESESGESMSTVDRAVEDGREVGIVDQQRRMLTPNGREWVQKARGAEGPSGS